MITKANPNSEFWKEAEAASSRVAKFPPWKLGVIEPRPRPRPQEVDCVGRGKERCQDI